jgi:hypothetical protein
MAKGKRKRANEAKLRVIAGGAAPKAIVTKRAPSTSPAADARPKAGPPNLRREVEAKRAAEVENDESVDTRESAVAEVARERKSPFPRALIYGGLVVALGAAAWAITRGSTEPKPTAPAAAASAPVEWPSSAPSVIAVPPPVETVAEPPVASVSAPVSASVSVQAPPSASVPPVASAPAPVASTPAPTVAPKPPAPPPPPAPKPKPADDDPYQ